MLNENNIRCFLSVAETLNFTKTSKQLYMSQQSVSQHIARMEERLGFPLFIRSRSHVALTTEGEAFRAFFQDVSERYQKLLEEQRAAYSDSCAAPVLIMGSQNWIDLGPAFAAARRALRQEVPEFEIRSVRQNPNVLRTAFLRREVQVAVMYAHSAPQGRGIEVTPLIEVPVVLLASPDYPTAGHPQGVEDFCGEPLILERFDGESEEDTRQRAERQCSEVGLRPSRLIIVPDRDTAFTEADMGQGVVLTTSICRIMRSGNLRQYPTSLRERLVWVCHTDEKNELAFRYLEKLLAAFRVA